jgi:hypothetical protein
MPGGRDINRGFKYASATVAETRMRLRFFGSANSEFIDLNASDSTLMKQRFPQSLDGLRYIAGDGMIGYDDVFFAG